MTSFKKAKYFPPRTLAGVLEEVRINSPPSSVQSPIRSVIFGDQQNYFLKQQCSCCLDPQLLLMKDSKLESAMQPQSHKLPFSPQLIEKRQKMGQKRGKIGATEGKIWGEKERRNDDKRVTKGVKGSKKRRQGGEMMSECGSWALIVACFYYPRWDDQEFEKRFLPEIYVGGLDQS